jgi:hypothetical protein
MTEQDWNANGMVLFGAVFGSVVTLTVLAALGPEHCVLGNWAEWTTGIFTAGLIGMAGFQLRRQTIQQRQWATLQACDRYDTDPTLTEARRTLRALKAGETLQQEEHDTVSQITTVFNYFDAIAIGVDQRLYVDRIAESHLKEIMFRRLAELWESRDPIVQKFGADYFEIFPTFNALLQRWDRTRYAEMLSAHDVWRAAAGLTRSAP